MDIKITPKQRAGMPVESAKGSEPAESKTTSAGLGETADVLENASRPDFFSGRLLAAEDLQQDQEYLGGKQDARYVDAANNFWNRASLQAKDVLLAEGSKLRTELPKLAEEAGNDTRKLGDAISTEISNSLQRYFRPGQLSKLDIEAMVFIVLMEATKSAQEDLRNTLGQKDTSQIGLQYSSLPLPDIISKVQVDFPDLSGDGSIQHENIRAREAIEYSYMIEKSRIEPSDGNGSDDDPDD